MFLDVCDDNRVENVGGTNCTESCGSLLPEYTFIFDTTVRLTQKGDILIEIAWSKKATIVCKETDQPRI